MVNRATIKLRPSRASTARDRSGELRFRTQLWTFVNSAFGLWLLGTVSLGFLGWSWNAFTAVRARTFAIDTYRDHASNEVISRLSASMLNLAIDTKTSFADANNDLAGGERGYLFQEYKGLPLRRVLYDLYDYFPEQEARARQIIETGTQLERRLLIAATRVNRGDDPASVDDRTILYKEISVLREKVTLLRDAPHRRTLLQKFALVDEL